MTPESACRAAKDYEAYLRDVASLEFEASCQASTRMHRGDCRDQHDQGVVDLLYLFAHANETKRVFWSAYDPSDPSGYAQTFWAPVPGLDNVIAVVGAAPYRLREDRRYLYLFARVQDEAAEKLVYVRYNLELQSWEQEAERLDIPDDATAFVATVIQSYEDDVPPELLIQPRNPDFVGTGFAEGPIYYARLSHEGNDWEQRDEWARIVTNSGNQNFSLLAAVLWDGGENRDYVLFARNGNTNTLQYYYFLRNSFGGIGVGLSWQSVGEGAWLGALLGRSASLR